MVDDKTSSHGPTDNPYHVMRFDRAAGRDSSRAVGIGIDFGTTNSAAAIFDGERVTVVQLERSGAIMPSASYIDTEFTVRTGNDAIRTYIESNRGRRVEFRAEVLGEGRSSTGQIDAGTGLPGSADTETIYGREVDDAGLPGRLFHGIKRLLGSRDADRVVIFRRPFRLVALITPVLVRIREAVDATLRVQSGGSARRVTGRLNDSGAHSASGPAQTADHACIGYPVRFEGSDADSDARAVARLGEAYRYAGITEQTFCPEPIAAAIGYLYSNPPGESCRALAVDFGGGTLDLCVIRYRDSTLQVESVHGLALGGNKIDQAVFRALLFPQLGSEKTLTRVIDGRSFETAFPFWMYEERLLNWQVTYTLNQNKYTTPLLEQINRGGEGVQPFERLYHLIAQNYGYETFGAIRGLKERLSVESAGVLDIPEIDVHVGLGRIEFEQMIADAIRRFGEAIDITLGNANLRSADIDIVLRTGGSALIPAFAGILNQRFPGKIVEQDAFTSVAAGLAIADYYGFGIAATPD